MLSKCTDIRAGDLSRRGERLCCPTVAGVPPINSPSPSSSPPNIADSRPGLTTHPLLIRALITLAAWLVAFLILIALFAGFGGLIEPLSLTLKALLLSGVLVSIMGNLVMPFLVRVAARATRSTSLRPILQDEGEHARLDVLPEWPSQTVGVLATATQDSVHSIPISEPVRAGDRRLLLSLHRSRGSLARLRLNAEVGVSVLAASDVAFTARGRARVLAESMRCAADYAAIVVEVHHIDDHRQPGFAVTSGVDRTWRNQEERDGLRRRVDELREWAAVGTSPASHRRDQERMNSGR